MICGPVHDRVLDLIEGGGDRAQPQAPLAREFAGELAVGADLPRQRLQDRAAAVHLGAQLAARFGDVGDGLVIEPGDVPVADLRERFQITRTGQLVNPQVAHYIQGGAAVQGADGGGLALPGGGADHVVGLEQRRADELAARVGRERDLAEYVGGAGLEQRVRDGLGLGQVVPSDPQVQPPGVLVRYRLGPGRRVRAAQPRGQRLPALDDVAGGDAVRQVQFGAPAVAVAVHVGDERDAGAVLDHGVDGSDAERPQRAGDHLGGGRLVGGRHDRGPDDRLAVGSAVPHQHRHRGHRGERPAPQGEPADHGQQDGHRGHCGHADDLPAGGPGLAALHVGVHRVVMAGTPGPNQSAHQGRSPSRARILGNRHAYRSAGRQARSAQGCIWRPRTSRRARRLSGLPRPLRIRQSHGAWYSA